MEHPILLQQRQSIFKFVQPIELGHRKVQIFVCDGAVLHVTPAHRGQDIQPPHSAQQVFLGHKLVLELELDGYRHRSGIVARTKLISDLSPRHNTHVVKLVCVVDKVQLSEGP
jgi:hypothetical protein